MAGQKKNSGQKNTNKTTKPSPSKSASSKASGAKSTTKIQPAEKPNHNQQWSVVLFAIAILILLLAIIQGSAGWLMIHKALKGFFGLSLLMIPVMLGYIAVMLDQDETSQKILRRTLTGLVAIAFLSGFLEIMFGDGRLLRQTYSSAVQLLYNDGMEWKSGGILSALIAIPLLDLFGDTGSKIIICLLLFISVMWLTKKGLMDFLRIITKPFRAFWALLRDDYEDAAAIKSYEQEETEREKRSEQSDKEAIDMVAAQEKKRANGQEPQFLIDVPVVQTGGKHPDESSDTITKQVIVTETPAEQDDALEELIRQATEKPKKKTKKELQEEAVTEIAEEVAQQANAESAAVQYQIPPLDFLSPGESFAGDPNASTELRDKADRLREVLQSFNVSVRITNIARGPAVTRYEVQPAAGVKVSKITSLADDIALSLAAQGVRIEAPIPGKAAIGIEVPNSKKDIVSLREILESIQFRDAKSKLTFAVGKDIAGNVIIGDIAKMPHMIVAGTTGSGKSICTNSIIMSILYHALPSEVKLILIDPKIVEFRVYDGIPHLLIPVVTDPKKAAGALNWAVQEMLQRYQTFAENGVRDLADYNRMCAECEDLAPMPQIVIAIDELADLMMAASKEVEDSICRLAQMARAAGMHLIISTQRPTTDVITGLIKANIPSRVALKVKAAIDSRIILDEGGAEKLLGNGDMLFMPNGQPKPVRVQGCYVSTQEIERTVGFIKQQSASAYDEAIMQAVEQIAASGTEESSASEEESQLDGDAELIEKAIEVVVSAGQASTSNLQRRLKLGYARAARIMDELEEMGIIGPYEGAKPRRVLLSKMQYEERKLRKMNDNH